MYPRGLPLQGAVILKLKVDEEADDDEKSDCRSVSVNQRKMSFVDCDCEEMGHHVLSFTTYVAKSVWVR